MKKNILFAAMLLCFTLAWTACEKHDPEFFDEGANGAYFDYETAADFDKTLNFSDYIVGHPDTVSLMLKVKLLGYLMDEERTLGIKINPIEGLPLANVLIDKVVFADREYEKDVEVKIVRPETENVISGVSIYLDGSGDIGPGINGKEEIQLFVTESYGMPVGWTEYLVKTLLGEWSKEKHIYLAKHTGDNYFYEKFYDQKGQLSLNNIMAFNVSAVNALLSDEPSEEIEVAFPIVEDSYYPAYTKPYFWSRYENKLGYYNATTLCRLAALLPSANTQVLLALCNDDSEKKLENAVDALHKDMVTEMLEEYYGYAEQGIAIAEYKGLCWVEIQNKINYTMHIPYWWEDPKGLGTAEIVKKYFGEYSDEKYQFMLKTMMKKEGTTDFVAASILPFIYDVEHNTYAWDHSPLGKNQLSGEERLKECYRIIKAEYDLWAGYVDYEIPTVKLD